MKWQRSLMWILLTAVLGVLAGAIAARMLAQKTVALQGGTWLPEPRALPLVALTDFNGQPFNAVALRGHPSLVFFGFSYCADVCPATLATLREVRRLAPLAGLRVLFITVDPDRDTPAVLRQYLGGFDRGITGLIGAPRELAKLQRALGAAAIRQALPGGGYALDHSATLYLLDTRGRLAAVFTAPLAAATLLADLRNVATAGVL